MRSSARGEELTQRSAADLTGSQPESMVEEVAGHYGRLDIMVNCSGLNRGEKAGEVTEERFDYVLDVVAPTFVRTEQVAQTLSDALFYNGLAARISLGRIAEPDEVANAALFFVSGAFRFHYGTDALS